MDKLYSLSIAIVTYSPDLALLEKVLQRLARAAAFAKQREVLGRSQLFVVDNGPGAVWRASLGGLLEAHGNGFDVIELLSGHGNVGYGAGHNLALEKADAKLHLVLNPDVLLEADAIFQALSFMTLHAEAGLLAPAVTDAKGDKLYLCKRYPAFFDLFLRGFSPVFLQRFLRARLARYEMRDCIGDTVVFDVPLVSGCFMLFRRSVITRAGGFAPVYFLYFEDFDLSLRVAKAARIAYVPTVRITHFGGNAAKKGWRHVLMFLRSAIIFFRRNGWKWF